MRKTFVILFGLLVGDALADKSYDDCQADSKARGIVNKAAISYCCRSCAILISS